MKNLPLLWMVFAITFVSAQPGNDDCSGATSLTAGSTCSSTAASTTGATASAVVAPSCQGAGADDDVWFSFIAGGTNESLTLSGSSQDMAFAVYSGTCGSLTELACSDPSVASVGSLTVGTTYYVRAYTVGTGSASDFDFCVQNVGPCGTPMNQDYCAAPAVLTAGAGTFSSNTSGTYTGDIPANLGSVFCGSIENNSWYSFVADASGTATFNFTVSNCADAYGIQAQVYDVTTDINGCCTNFTSMSNCFNPGDDSNGSVNATGLTPGQTYYLMVDGDAGDVCDFSVTNWSATGILSVQLTKFGGIGLPTYNVLNWTTKSEINCDYYELQRSYDGITFEKVGQITGSGSTNDEHNYSYKDEDVRVGVAYYRLNQVDFDGKNKLSEVIQLTRDAQGEGIIALYPNPASQQVTVETNIVDGNVLETLQLISPDGKVIEQQSSSSIGFNKFYFNLSSLSEGIYFVKIQTKNGLVQTERFIKK